MGTSVFPAPSAGGGIKSVQRGSAGSSGNVTITAVNISKSFVNIYGTASSGTVAASGAISASNGTVNAANGTASATTISVPTAQIGYVGVNGNTVAWGSYDMYANESGLIGKVLSHTSNAAAQNVALNSTSVAMNSQNISGGSNNLVAAVVQGFLANSTTLTVSGACRWEVVEFN